MTIGNKKNTRNSKRITQKKLAETSKPLLNNIAKAVCVKDINKLALDTKFIQRTSSKITGAQFLTSLLVASQDPEHATLERLSDHFRSIYRIRIRAQSIMERINHDKSILFLSHIFEKFLKNQFTEFVSNISPCLLAPFSKVLIQDSTICNLNEHLAKHLRGSGGRASKSAVKLDVIFDFKNKIFEQITLHEGCTADQALANNIIKHITKNTLIIRDLGYLQMMSLNTIIDQGAFYLSRMKNNTSVYLHKEGDEQLNLNKYLRKNFKKSKFIDIPVFITASRVPVRLIVYKVPAEIAEKRRKDAQIKAKKEGRTLTKKSLNLLKFSFFITNVPLEIWPPEVVGTIYRIRWQIELMFKDWKGRLKIDYLKGTNIYRIYCLLYAKLILLLITNEICKLMSEIGDQMNIEVSVHKVYSWLRCSNRIIRVMAGRLEYWELRYLDDLIKTCMATQKRKRKSTLMMVFEQDSYYMERS